MILDIDHVQLAMPKGQEAEARAFYLELLACQEIQKPAVLAARGGCWFASGKAQIHLGVEEAFKPAKKAHPAFIVQNLDVLASTLQNANYPVTWDDKLPEVRRFYTQDPFGNRLEFMQGANP